MVWKVSTREKHGRSMCVLAKTSAEALEVARDFYGEGVNLECRLFSEQLYVHKNSPICESSLPGYHAFVKTWQSDLRKENPQPDPFTD